MTPEAQREAKHRRQEYQRAQEARWRALSFDQKDRAEMLALAAAHGRRMVNATMCDCPHCRTLTKEPVLLGPVAPPALVLRTRACARCGRPYVGVGRMLCDRCRRLPDETPTTKAYR